MFTCSSFRFASHLLGAFAAAWLVTTRLEAQFSYSESFKNSTAAGWSFYQGNSGPAPRLTSGTTPDAADPEAGGSVIDASGSGWLRLATTTANQSNAAYFDTSVPSANDTITVRFNVALWGDNGSANGGDGLTFFMRDASQPFQVGAFGGSIGYAQKTGIDGVDGGYFGVALDVYGNYSNPTEGRIGGVGARENAVVLRGPGDGQTGYNYLAGTSGYNYTTTGSATTRDTGDPVIAALARELDFSTATSRPDQATLYRTVEVSLDVSSQLTVKMQFGEDSGAWTTLFTASLSSFTRPDQLAFGFSAGTGGANQVYEISNLTVQATSSSNVYTWDNSTGNNLWQNTANATNWVQNTNPPASAVVIFPQNGTTAGSRTVSIAGESKTVDSLKLNGNDAYTISSSNSGYKIIFDAAGSGNTSFLEVTASANGSASHTINSGIQLNNTLIVQNDATGKTLTFGGAIETQGNNLTVAGSGNTTFSNNITGGGVLEKDGVGTLRFDSTIDVTELRLGGGTLLLGSANITASTLHITANTILDFGSTVPGSILNFTDVIIDAGVTLSINNWTDTVDFFYAQNNPGATTLSQIVFNGYSNAATKWLSANKQITPVPEPATYGVIFMGAALGLFGWSRLRRKPRRP